MVNINIVKDISRVRLNVAATTFASGRGGAIIPESLINVRLDSIVSGVNTIYFLVTYSKRMQKCENAKIFSEL